MIFDYCTDYLSLIELPTPNKLATLFTFSLGQLFKLKYSVSSGPKSYWWSNQQIEQDQGCQKIHCQMPHGAENQPEGQSQKILSEEKVSCTVKH